MLHINIVGVVTRSDNSTRRLVTCSLSLDLLKKFISLSRYTVPLLQRQHHNTRKKLILNKMLSILMACNFMSCNFVYCIFMPCNFDDPSFSCPSFSAPPSLTQCNVLVACVNAGLLQESDWLGQRSHARHVDYGSHRRRHRGKLTSTREYNRAGGEGP